MFVRTASHAQWRQAPRYWPSRATSSSAAHYETSKDGQIRVGQMYVQYQIPDNRTQPYPVVMWHGGGQTGTNFMGTPDGRKGWGDYFLQRGYAVYIVDQPGRARSGYFTDVYGPTRRPNTDAMSESLHRAGTRAPISSGEAAHAVAGRRHRRRSDFRPVLRVAGGGHGGPRRHRAAEPRRRNRAARQDRAVDPAHALAIGTVRLGARRRAAEARQGHPRDRAQRPALLREHRGRRARLVQGRSDGPHLGHHARTRSRFRRRARSERPAHHAADRAERSGSRALLAARRVPRRNCRICRAFRS